MACQAGQQETAIQSLEQAIRLKPDDVEAYYNLGLAFQGLRRFNAAIACYHRALELNPSFAEAWNNLGNVFKKQQKLDSAVACYRRTIELRPNDAQPHSNLGHALQELGNLDEAVSYCRRAIKLNPELADAHVNLGQALQKLGELVEAEKHFSKALELDSGCAEAHLNQSMLKLLKGDFERGWTEYEWRWKTGQVPVRQFPQPRWNGESLAENTIMIRAEQGLGDAIQFIRYANAVKALGGTVVVECQKSLVKLLANCPGIDRLVGQGDELPPFDFHAPLLSLPGVFKTTLDTIPAKVPYVFADPALVDEWREKLSGIDGFRIGINWHGRGGQGSFRLRDIPLDHFAALTNIRGVRLISLQKGDGREELKGAAGRLPIVDLGEDVDGAHGPFLDTAAIMKNVDLVITSDTAIPHLAGALGVPVWLALPSVADWRWLLERSDSPWYPTMRLFRQKKAGDWAGVFEEIVAALRDLISVRQNRSVAV
jgi:Flp pilus assembly protein TadD